MASLRHHSGIDLDLLLETAPGLEHLSVEEMVLAALRAGPRTGFELARVLEAAAPGLLAEREGCLYPVLGAMARTGEVEGLWVRRDDGRPRKTYRLPDRGPPAAPPPGPPADGAAP